MIATAPNDNQKPGDNAAHGSSTTTGSKAAHNTAHGEIRRLRQSANATTASIYTVRCAGIAKPASHA